MNDLRSVKLSLGAYARHVKTNEAPTALCSTIHTFSTHGGGDVAGEAFWAERLIGVWLVIPEWFTELVLIAFESQLSSKFAVLVCEFRADCFNSLTLSSMYALLLRSFARLTVRLLLCRNFNLRLG